MASVIARRTGSASGGPAAPWMLSAPAMPHMSGSLPDRGEDGAQRREMAAGLAWARDGDQRVRGLADGDPGALDTDGGPSVVLAGVGDATACVDRLRRVGRRRGAADMVDRRGRLVAQVVTGN